MVDTILAKVLVLTCLTTTSIAFDFAQRAYSDAKTTTGFSPQLPNIERVDNIFSLLADIQPQNNVRSKSGVDTSPLIDQYSISSREDSPHDDQMKTTTKDTETNGIDPGWDQYPIYDIVYKDVNESNLDQDDILNKKENEQKIHMRPTKDHYDIVNINENLLEDAGLFEQTNQKTLKTSAFKYYLKLFEAVSKSSLVPPKQLEEFLSTFDKASKIYDSQRHELFSKLPEKLTHSKNLTDNLGVLKSTSTVIGKFLDPPNIEKVLDVTSKAGNEDEILELLTSVILGPEDRSGGGYGGYGLTLDPVTCIALLTLAAYLIRAVFQLLIATATTGKRRRRTSNLLSNLSNIPGDDIASKMVKVYNMISLADTEFLRYKGDTVSKEAGWRSRLMLLPSEIALALKLSFDGNESCFRKFLCSHLVGRSLFDFGASEIFWSAIGLYKGEYGLANLISKDLQNKDKICENFSKSCKNSKEENCFPCTTMKTIGYRQTQSFVHLLFEKLVNSSEYLKSFFK